MKCSDVHTTAVIFSISVVRVSVRARLRDSINKIEHLIHVILLI